LAAAGLPPLPRTAWAEIDLDALASNLAVLRVLAGEGTPVHPVVKADAYGHGAIPVAKALAEAGADGFCVASFDEAIALRDAGIAQPIVVLYPVPPALATEARRRGIAVTAGDATLLEELLAALAASSDADSGVLPPLDLQLEVETGLGRGGLSGPALVAAARAIQAAAGVRLAGLWTHLQAPEDGPRTAGQLERFEGAATELRSGGVNLPARHVAATGGLLLDGVAALDGVRPGLAIYGLVPDELLPGTGIAGSGTAGTGMAGSGATGSMPATRPGTAGLRPVLSLHARPVRVAELPAGTGISYGPTFTTRRPSRIATLPIGYGDGWPRALSNRADALVRGRRVPLVGNVAMDAVMADVTDVPGEPVTVDDELVLIGSQGGEQITAAEVAAARGTNSWEVVTSLAARLPRVYHAASVPRQVRTLFPDEVGSRRSMRP
jgi:alanine racemase